MTNNYWTIAPTRERCENCGRYTEISKQWYSDELGHGVCNRCAEPVESVSLADTIGYDAELNPMDNYADYFENIQNNGPYNFYYCDD